MQIVNPLRAALPYITLQTAKVQRCWADYFIFRGFAGAAGRFGSAETHELRSCRPPSGRAGLRPIPAVCGNSSLYTIQQPHFPACHLSKCLRQSPFYTPAK